MKINFKIKETVSKISKEIKQAFLGLLIASHAKNKSKVEQRIREFVKECVRKSPEMQDIFNGGRLSAILGVPYGKNSELVEQILDSVYRNLNINISAPSRFLTGKIEFSITPNISQISVENIFTTENNYKLNWLDWLLNKGDSTIIVGYQFVPKSGSGRSKSGIMSKGGYFRIPPEFSGVDNDNFITRSIAENSRELSEILQDLF